jgi:drug/metabolite transporter (DMT)-like permease
MTLIAFLQLGLATGIFILAGTVAKAWAVSPEFGKLALAIALYIAGNLIMMRLLREVGMSSAFSATNVLQLVALNLIAIFVFHERIGLQQGLGVAFAIIGVVLIAFAPRALP